VAQSVGPEFKPQYHKEKKSTTIWSKNPTTGIVKGNHMLKDSCTPMFITAWFTIAKIWIESALNVLSVDE
jgi:hypothetical protein